MVHHSARFDALNDIPDVVVVVIVVALAAEVVAVVTNVPELAIAAGT